MDEYIQALKQWLEEGYKQGFCTKVYCQTHDGFDSEDSEIVQELIDEYDFDYCWHVVRVKTL